MHWLRTPNWCSLISIATWNRRHQASTNIIPMRTMFSPWVAWGCNNSQCLNLNTESNNNSRWCLLLSTFLASHIPTLSNSKRACSQTCSISIINPTRTLTSLIINNLYTIYLWTWIIKLTLWHPSRNWPRENYWTSRVRWALLPVYKTTMQMRVLLNIKT